MAVWALFAPAAHAETDFRALSDRERLLLGEELRAVLLTYPEIVERALNPSPYSEDIASDLDLIEQNSEALFAGRDMALFVGADCADCPLASRELLALTEAREMSVNILNINDNARLAEALQIDVLPFYVMPEVMLRGAMPAPVLERFLDRR